MECGVQRAFLAAQRLVGHAFDRRGDPVTVERASFGEEREHQEWERTLESVLPRHAKYYY
jgi:hypothetical protein